MNDRDLEFCPACQTLTKLGKGNALQREVCSHCYETHVLQLEDGDGAPTWTEERISEWDAMAEHYG